MSWYDVWLSQQLENLPYCLRELRIQGESLLAGLCLDKLFDAIRDFTQINEGVSIDEIVRHLQNIDILDNASDLLGPQRLLIFAVLGWRSMLYQAGFNVCSIQELAVHQDSSQPQSGFVFDTYKVPAELSDRPLSVLLKAFGNILPARSSTVPQVASETSKLASSWLPLYPVETNAYMLHTLLRVHIRWVDALALHLDYDKSSRTLSLFSYPSFCLDTLASNGLIYSFASIERYGIDPRADKEDISQLLREVLLSYRLLFGQSAKSRRLFRQIFKPSEKHGSLFDSLLPLVCTRKQFPIASTSIVGDRPVYFAARDFPVLYERIELIAKELKDARPNSIGNLIRDRRDTLQFWTFWLVSIVGGLSILLSLIQVVLQGVQLTQN
ncbi:uncharacterized protein ATNIH1004_002832 [Aspergillus tanneri]|uniref:Uncharacterized protein n=1 Tax=Aspergillus tanneri TaxID=1220188 RepID=A0A5M9MSP0_9EURO|nr:uncharacterized protein ATNIH1004_002832 [Aspergillus tanneri]KAA8650151.1 hypothetical protein ATNIH1004_002832 [Aspergillus tanneri]